MRFVHAADIHLDSPLRNLVLEDEAQIGRLRRATREAFQALVDLCIARQASFLVLAGDLYDLDDSNMQIAVFFRAQLVRLKKANVRVAIKLGNHDAGNRITSALDLPDNARIFGSRRPESIAYDDLGVVLHGQSFKQGRVTENLAANYPARTPGMLNIGVLHTSLAGSPDHDPYAPCQLEDLTSRGYAYWALGHVHKAATLARDPWVVYPGNLQGRHAKETGPKGCVVVDADGDRIVSAEPVALDVVRWFQPRLDLTGVDHEAELIEGLRATLGQAARDADDRPSAVRIVLTGRTALSGDIARRPERLRQTVLELAGETSGEVWLEQLRDETIPPGVPSAREGATGASDDLLRVLEEIAADPSLIASELEEQLAPLKAKLPEGLKDDPALRALTDPAAARDALASALPRLAGRLSGEEG